MNLRKLLRFSLVVAGLSFVVAVFMGMPRLIRATPTEFLYLLTMLVSFFAFYFTPLLLLRLLVSGRTLFRRLTYAYSALWVIYFLFDTLQFKIFRSHLSYFVAMNTIEGFKAGEVGDMKISKALVGQIIVVAVLFYALLIFFYRRIESRGSDPAPQSFFADRKSRATLAFCLLLMWIPIGSQRIWIKGFGWSRLLENHLSPFDQFNAASFIPHEGSRYFTFRTEMALHRELVRRAEALPDRLNAREKPNLLFIHLESLRWDSLTPERMPFLWKRMEKCKLDHTCITTDSHYTSGNNTPTGIFGILSGLNSFYYYPFRQRKEEPPALKIFKKLGYARAIWLSTSLTYDDLNTFLFKDFKIVDRPQDDGHNALHFEYQTEITERLLNNLRQSSSAPRLDYLQSYLTHFNYYFSDACETHKPYIQLPYEIGSRNFRHMEGQFPLLKNRFLNAVCETDRLIEHIFDELDKMHRLKNTIIVVFGDHGEEFGEHGRFGHSYGLNDEQTRTVFGIFFPKVVPPSQYVMSSHSDVVPTLFDYMGVAAPVETMTNGKSLFRYDPQRDFVLVGMGTTGKNFPVEYAAVNANYKVLFENQSLIDADNTEVFDRHDVLHMRYDRSQVQNLLERIELSKQIPWTLKSR